MTVARHTKHGSDTRATGSVVGLILIAALIAALVIGVGGWMYAHNGLGASHAKTSPVASASDSPATASASSSTASSKHEQRPVHDTLERKAAPAPDLTTVAEEKRMSDVSSAVTAAVAGNGGIWSVYVEDLATGKTVSVGGQPMVAASDIKLYVMLAVYDKQHAGTLAAGGQDTTSLINQMITVSSNAATNQLVLMVGDGDMATGMQRVTGTAARYGFSSSKQLRVLSDAGTDGTGTENWTSASDCGRFLAALYRGKLVSAEASRSMLDVLLGQTRRAKIPAGVPSGIQVANKTGELAGVENDAAVVWGKAADGTERDYVMVVMTSGVVSGTAQQQIAALSSQVYEAMTA